MEAKKATDILIKLSKKSELRAEEKEAVLFAVGVMSWVSLSESRLKNLKEKRDKRKEERY